MSRPLPQPESLSLLDDTLQTLAEAMPSLAWVALPDGDVTWYNRRFYDYTGCTLEHMRSAGWQSILHPEHLVRIRARWKDALEGEQPYELEFPLRDRDGAFRWHLIRTAPMRGLDGRLSRWFGTATDIDDQRRDHERQTFLAIASKELASSLDYEETLRTIARIAVPSFADWSAVDMLAEKGNLRRLAVHHANPELVALAHRMHEEYPVDMSAPHGLPQVLRTGQTEWARDIPDELLVAGAKDEKQLELTRSLGLKSYIVVPLKTPDRVLGAVTLVQAESGRRFTESDVALMEELGSRASLAIQNAELYREVRELNATLEQRVQERTAELRDANAELESFTYSVSHDLRAPLRHITGFAQLLEKRAGDSLDTTGRDYLDTISEAAKKGGQLVDDLLAFSRLGRAELKTAPVDVARIVDEVRRDLRPDFEGRKVTWRIEPIPAVRADADLLRGALKNLISNALKYSRERPEAIIEIGGRPSGQQVEVYVRDNGVGFEMAYVEKLFGVFQRLHSADQFEGTGIGLANVRRIIHRHGGRVWAEGAVDQGATFHITLPRAESAS